MDRITEKSLNIIASRHEGIRQSDLWKLLKINFRECSKITRALAAHGFIRRQEVILDGIIKTYLLTLALPVHPRQLRRITRAYRDILGIPSLYDLIQNHRLIVDGHVVRGMDDIGTGPCRILAGPLRDILVNDLKNGGCSFRDLADRHTISFVDIRNEIKSLIHSDLPLEQGCLVGRSGHRRHMRSKGSEHVYRLIPIPVKARVFDPFLGFSLLDWTRFLALPGDEPRLVPVPGVIAAYRDLVSTVFGIMSETIEAFLARNNCIFVSSTFGPVPVLTRSTAYQDIFASFTGRDVQAPQIQLSDAEVERGIREIEAFILHEPVSLTGIQQHVLALSDMLRLCRNDGNGRYLDRLESINEQFFRKLFCPDSLVPIHARGGNPVERIGITLPWTIQGSGDRDIVFDAPSGTVSISGEYLGEGRFILLRKTRTTTSLVHATPVPGLFSDIIPTNKGRACFLEVRADGPWSLRFTSPSFETAGMLPFRILGQGRQVTDPFIMPVGGKIISVSHYGSGRIVVLLRNNENNVIIPVFEGKGPQEISRTIRNGRLRIGWLDVHAQGNWRIIVKNELNVNPES
jgi:DNA-binding Lrp family transcriptional regulator